MRFQRSKKVPVHPLVAVVGRQKPPQMRDVNVAT
jgi:hypothetical protein